EMAFGNADVMEKMDKAFLEDAMDEMKSSALVAVDGNLNEEALAYLFDELQDVPVFFDPENPQKAARAKEYIGKFYMIKPNRLEAEAITGMEILSEEQLYAAGDWFAEKGVKKIFISLSGGGVFYREGDKAGILRPKNIVMKNTIGAGDTFSAALIHGELKGLDIEALANYAMAASEIKIETKEAVNPR
ncbi:MAG: PfkB family carbohydrate kinase, partial [Anaerovoracaceae bacterium]